MVFTSPALVHTVLSQYTQCGKLLSQHGDMSLGKPEQLEMELVLRYITWGAYLAVVAKLPMPVQEGAHA
jgi:hypothetical protein